MRVGPATADPAQLERGRAEAADVPHHRQDAGHDGALRPPDAGPVGEARRHQALRQQLPVGHRHGLPVAPTAAAARRREHLAAHDVDHRAGHDDAVDGRGDADRHDGEAVPEVHRAVERVDHPLQPARAA